MKHPALCRMLVSLFVGSIFVEPPAAQTTASGSVRGVARDQQGAVVPGVSVTATSTTVPGARETITDADGQYRLLELPPGDYTIVAELTGFARFLRTPVTVRAGLNLDLDLVMSVGSIDETVEVRQDTPLLETRTAVHAVNISGELQRAMPLSERREWFGALTLAPGVTTADWTNNEKLFFVHGADPAANVIQIDGADIGAVLSSGLGYVGLNTDAIDDIQIKTAGVDASAPLGVGGIVNIAAASGTNRVKGNASVFVQPRAWNASNTPGGTSSTADQRQIDLSMGAPIVKDRLWGFGAYRYTDIVTGINRTAAQLDALRLLVPGFTPFDATNEAHFWFAKANASLSSRHQLSGFYQRDVNPVAFADAVAEHLRAEATGGAAVSVRLSSVWSDRFTTRFGASYNDKARDSEPPNGTGPLRRVYQGTLLSGGRLLGNGRLVDLGTPVTALTGQPTSNVTLSLDTTLFAQTALGSHELQTGVYAQPRMNVVFRTSYINDGFVFEEAVLRSSGPTDVTVIPFHRLVIGGTELTSASRRGQDFAFYVQDAWRPTGRLTIGAGLRIDRIVWVDRIFDVTSQRSTELGPRVGINYALTADNRTVARAHWVRVHDAPSRTTTGVGTSNLAQRDTYDLDLNGTFETVFETPATTALTPNRTIAPDFHQPFIDEWGLGLSRQLGGNTTGSVAFVNREFIDRPTLVETNGRFEGQMFTGYVDESVNDVYRIANNDWNRPVYRSIEASLTKRSDRLQGIASYVRQWRHIDGTWQPNDPASFIQPSAFENHKGIGSPSGSTATTADANSLSGSHMSQRSTSSGQWQDHVVRAGIVCRGPWDVLIGSNYTYQSGIWSGPIITRVAAADPAFGPATVTLSNGRRVTNPLSTLFRFAFPTRSEGQLKTAPLHVWNLRVGRRAAWHGLKFDLAVDIFNVMNNGTDSSFQPGAVQTFNPAYGTTTFRQLPRSAQVVVRTWF